MENIKEAPPSPLRLERFKQGIKPWRIAQVLGVSQTLYSYWELGRRRCPADKRHEIAKLLNARVEDIFPQEYDALERTT